MIVTDKPNYSYEVIYGMPRREINEVVDELKAVKGVTDVNIYKAGEHAYMWYEDIDKNQLYPVVKNTLPNYLINQHFGERGEEYTNINETNQHLVEDSVIANVYGISTDDSLFGKLEESVSKGLINKEKFDAGKEVIVLMPMYWINDKIMAEPVLDSSIINNTNFKNRLKIFGDFTKAFGVTYDFRYKDLYHEDQSLSPGDTLQVTIPTEDIEGEQKIMDVAFHDIKVGGILYYFPGIGMWPFSDTVESPVIIGSYSLLEKFYPKTKLGLDRHLTIEQLSQLVESFLPTKYGKTYFNIHTDGKADNVDLFVELQRIAMEREYTFINYQENIDTVFAKAFNFTCIVGILGAVIAGIGMIILYNTTLSKVEQERDRIGILQSLGVGSKQFNGLYLMVGLLSGVIALGIAHIILIIIIYFTLDYTLWLYPWKLHFISSIIFLLFATLIYYLPIRGIIKNQPVSNIRSLSR